MPETDSAAAQPEGATDQQSATDEGSIDWKAKAREWEKRAKDNMTRLKEAEPQLAEYNRLVEASKTDLERAQEQANLLQKELETTQRAALINSVALEAGLDPSHIKRLNRDLATREELLADALELKSEFGSGNTTRAPAPDFSQGSSASGGSPGSPTQQFAALINQMPG